MATTIVNAGATKQKLVMTYGNTSEVTIRVTNIGPNDATVGNAGGNIADEALASGQSIIIVASQNTQLACGSKLGTTLNVEKL